VTGRRKLIAFFALLATLLGASLAGVLSEVLAGGAVAGYMALVGGNVGEHFAQRRQQAKE